MKEEKPIIYVNENCSYCKQVKDLLEEKDIEFTEKITENFIEEWHRTMYTVGMGAVPTVLFKGNYFAPGRDFNNPNQLVEILTYLKKPFKNDDVAILERIKTLNYNIIMALTDLNKTIMDMNKKLR